MNGMDGKLELPDNSGKWNSYYYRTHANIGYLHRFKKVDLDIAGNFGLSNFNFLPDAVAGKQKFTSGDIHFGVKSTDAELPLQFSAETNLMLYERQYDFGSPDNQENIIRTKALVAGGISDEQTVGIGFAMDNVLYKNNNFENYTSLNLNPHYRLENDDWKIRIGTQVDMAFGYGKKFRAAPDVAVEYNFSDSYILYAQAKGGRLQNDFRRLEAFCPYGLVASQPDATYEQVNIALGFKASPVAGLWLNLYGGYQNLRMICFSNRQIFMTTQRDTTGHLPSANGTQAISMPVQRYATTIRIYSHSPQPELIEVGMQRATAGLVSKTMYSPISRPLKPICI